MIYGIKNKECMWNKVQICEFACGIQCCATLCEVGTVKKLAYESIFWMAKVLHYPAGLGPALFAVDRLQVIADGVHHPLEHFHPPVLLGGVPDQAMMLPLRMLSVVQEFLRVEVPQHLGHPRWYRC